MTIQLKRTLKNLRAERQERQYAADLVVWAADVSVRAASLAHALTSDRWPETANEEAYLAEVLAARPTPSQRYDSAASGIAQVDRPLRKLAATEHRIRFPRPRRVRRAASA